jgi:hypothetical protein
VTTSDTAPSGAPVACLEAAVNPQELKEHLEQVHGIDVTDDSILGDIDWREAHQIDHDEWLADQHEHKEQ